MAGLVHVYTGDGKGKTTAAFGLALRCIGAGGSVLIIQFLKGKPSSEIKALKKLGAKCIIANPGIPFTNLLSHEEFKRHKTLAIKALNFSEGCKTNIDMIVLDEVIGGINCGFLSTLNVLEFINNKPPKTELVLTGANAPEEVCAAADYVSNIQKLKHPFDRGIQGRKGIEF